MQHFPNNTSHDYLCSHQNSDFVSSPYLPAVPNDIAFKTRGSDEHRVLNCGESVDNVTSVKFYMVPHPHRPFEFDVSNLVATFGDSKISREEIERVCGSKTSVGCPAEGLDRLLIDRQPGVEDTVLPFKLFPRTGDPKPVQVRSSTFIARNTFQTKIFVLVECPKSRVQY